jgi:hypothetical protein
MYASNELTGKPKIMRYNTTFSRLLKLVLDMSERERFLILEYAKSITDERTSPRRSCLIPVKCNLEKQSHKGLILDLNSAGAYIDINASLPVGQNITLSFFSPFSFENIQLGGKIIRSSTYGIGVSFDNWSNMTYIKMRKNRRNRW